MIDLSHITERPCERCSGKGFVMVYPYYAHNMPDMVQETCMDCFGKGAILTVPEGIAVRRRTLLVEKMERQKEEK